VTLLGLSQRFLAPIAQTLMIFGIIALCQPWSLVLHRYSVTIILIGLVGFTISAHIGPRSEDE
jgi:type IV secretory pathway VirB2 component (pilin)